MKNRRIIAMLLGLVLLASSTAGCESQAEKQTVNIGEGQDVNIEKTPEKVTPKDSIQFDLDLEITKIKIVDPFNPEATVEYETAFDSNIEIERYEFNSKKLYINVSFSQSIEDENNVSDGTDSLVKNMAIDEAMMTANEGVDVDTLIVDKRTIQLEVTIPFEESEEKDYNIVIPTKIVSQNNKSLKSDEMIKLKYIPKLEVKLQSNDENASISNDGASNNYFEVINKGIDYRFSIVFSGEVNKESVLEVVKNIYDKHDASYEWLSEKELEIKIENIQEIIIEGIDFAEAVDINGNKINQALVFILDVRSN